MGQTREWRDATHNLFKYLASIYFYKQKQEITVIRSETWTWYNQIEPLKKKSAIFPVVVWIWVFLKIPVSLRWVTWDKEEGSSLCTQFCRRENWGGDGNFFLRCPWNILYLAYLRSDFLLISASATLPFGRQAELWGPPADGSFPQY